MEQQFPIIISELRKERGLSQKEAAAKLGISQALLSHYEKGIRECGQSFLLRIADFYGVSTDYLLGRSKRRSEIHVWNRDIFDEQENFSSSSKTMLRAALMIVNKLREADCLKKMPLEITLAIEFYKIILIQASAGNLPKNWASKALADGEVCRTQTFIDLINSACDSTLKPTLGNSCPDEPVPEDIKMLIETAENYIFKHFAENIPPMPMEFLK